jgi:hypothetical protein
MAMMTGRDQLANLAPDGKDLVLALLTARLSELSEQVGALLARVGAAEVAIGEQASLLSEASGLAREVARLSAAIATPSTPGSGRADAVHPRQVVWAAMKDAEHIDALRDLASWVTGVLLYRYPGTGAVLPPCWPAHSAVVEDWLYWDWTSWALDPEARSRDAADWHDRWLPGALARIRPQLAICGQRSRHATPPSQRPVPAELEIADRHPEAVFIDKMARLSRQGHEDSASRWLGAQLT